MSTLAQAGHAAYRIQSIEKGVAQWNIRVGGYATAEEMVTWVRQYGMDPMETIRAATFWPAMSLGLQDKVGTVSVGKTADIIAVRENPLATIETLRNVQMVIKNGKRVK